MSAVLTHPENHTSETAPAGWGARIRTWEWRNQNQLDCSTISKRVWKKPAKRAPAISIAWQLFPNERQSLQGKQGQHAISAKWNPITRKANPSGSPASIAAIGGCRGRILHPRPSGYEPDELPGCSTPRHLSANGEGTFCLVKVPPFRPKWQRRYCSEGEQVGHPGPGPTRRCPPDGYDVSWMRVSQCSERWRIWEGSTARLRR